MKQRRRGGGGSRKWLTNNLRSAEQTTKVTAVKKTRLADFFAAPEIDCFSFRPIHFSLPLLFSSLFCPRGSHAKDWSESERQSCCFLPWSEIKDASGFPVRKTGILREELWNINDALKFTQFKVNNVNGPRHRKMVKKQSHSNHFPCLISRFYTLRGGEWKIRYSSRRNPSSGPLNELWLIAGCNSYIGLLLHGRRVSSIPESDNYFPIEYVFIRTNVELWSVFLKGVLSWSGRCLERVRDGRDSIMDRFIGIANICLKNILLSAWKCRV